MKPNTVVVVDDVEGNRVLAHAMLTRMGWDVVVFDRAEPALLYAEAHVPAAMLLDVRMPGLNGDVLASILRAQPATRGIRLVGYTAHALPVEMAALRACGFDEVLVKPIEFADMVRALPTPAQKNA